MDASFYEKLKYDFIMIRFLHTRDSFNGEKYDEALLAIGEARKMIDKHSIPYEKKVLLYCIDTLFEIMNEGDRQKIFDFADAIHNVPDLYVQGRDLYYDDKKTMPFQNKYIRKDLEYFQRKYGKRYFPFINEIKPRFNKNAPKNNAEFFFYMSDEDFKQFHPVEYSLLCVAGIIALFLPLLIYTAYCLFINPAPNEWPLWLGGIGSFIAGIGLFNIVAAWIHQYLGHLVTAVCLGGGTALTLLSMCFLYM